MLVNVTGSSFYVTWAVNSTASHTFRVEVLEMSALVRATQTGYPALGVTGLEPGVLYSVWITPLACGAEGVPVRQHVRTGKCHNSEDSQDIIASMCKHTRISCDLRPEVHHDITRCNIAEIRHCARTQQK